MMNHSRCATGARLALILVVIAAQQWLPEPARASADPKVTEWPVPYPNTRPRDPAVDSKGRVWFCGQAGAYLAWFDPGQGTFGKIDLADGAGPHNLIVDSEDNIWFAANTLPYIGRLDPGTGQITRYPMPDTEARDPHTLVFDPTGHLWFTAQWGNVIGRLDPGTGQIHLVRVPEAGARPYGIKIGPDGRPWVALFGTNMLATVDPQTLSIQLIELPRFEVRPRRLEITGDGAIWYGDYAGGFLGRYSPADQSFNEWPLPGGENARPYGTALDHRETIWIAEGGTPNRLAAFDTRSLAFTAVIDIPNARGSVRHMFFHRPTREIWFGEDSNYIGRVRIP